MAKSFEFQEYWDALNPFDSVGLKENILLSAAKDPNIDCMQFKQLVRRAYPEQQ